MKKAADFLERIKSTDGVVIIYNNDGDGICSCVMVSEYLKRTGKKKPYIISQPMPMDKNIVQRVKTGIPDKIILLDLAADQQQGVLKSLVGLSEVLVVDHHQVFKNMNSKRIVHYNPRIDDPRLYQSTSYCIYKILSKVMDVSDLLWVAAVGMVADYNLNDSKDLVKEVEKRYGFDKPLYETRIGRLADMIAATSATKKLSFDQMVDVFQNATFEKFEKTHNADNMIESGEVIKKEMDDLVEDAEANMERHGKVMFYNIKSKYNLSSPLSTRVSENYRDNLVVIYQKVGSRVKASSRNQSKNINAGKVIGKAAKEVGGSGGGHDAAAGATISADQWEKFKEILIKVANK